MKVVQVCPRYHPHIGGVEKYVKGISEELSQRGFEVEVLATDPSGKLATEETMNGVWVRRFKSFAPSEIGYFSKSLFDALKRTRSDIVHAHGYRAVPMLLAASAKTNNKAKLVVTPHLGFSRLGRSFYFVYNPLFGRFIFSKADKITLVSRAEMEEIPLLHGYRDKIVSSPIGINVKRIERHSNRNVSSRTLNLIYVGRIEKKKGLDTLIEIMSAVKELPIRLTIVGEGPHAARILPIIHRMQNIEFRGKVSELELYRLYARSHMFLLLSEFEAHSVSLTEAMAFGVVPIVSKVGGNRYIVDEETGFLVDYPVEIDTIVQLLEESCVNREILKEKSVVAKKKTLASFSVENVTTQLMQLYRETLVQK